MTDFTPEAHEAKIEADPAKPWKAIVAAVSAGLAAVLADYADELPLWATILIVAVLAGLATFVTANPLRVKETGRHRDEVGALEGPVNLLIWLLVVVVAVVLVVWLIRVLIPGA